MKPILAVALFALPMVARAEYFDVFEIKLKDACKLEQELQIVRDFNSQWGPKHGYSAEIVIPIENSHMGSIYWVGRTKDMATLGEVVDTFAEEARRDPDSVAGKLLARLHECEIVLSRSGYESLK